MRAFLVAVEATPLSTWLRDSPSLWAFPFVLILHTWGLAFLVGVNVAIACRVLGLARTMPLASLDRYFTVMWTGFWVNAVSGVLLLAAYPTKALTNPLFYGKLMLIAIGLLFARLVRRQMRADDRFETPITRLAATPLPTAPAAPFPLPLRALAIAMLLAWGSSIFAGRFLAYTYRFLLAEDMP